MSYTLSLIYGPSVVLGHRADSRCGPPHMHKYAITLPPSLNISVGPNPFCNSLLSYSPIVARPGGVVAVFPASFMDDGVYFLAKLVG